MSYQGLVTFIIPTVGRQTLLRAVESVRVQTDRDWYCMVLGDGLDPSTMMYDYRGKGGNPDITCHGLPHYRHEATVRNVGLRQVKTEWVAWLDDDDTVDENYVAWLREDIEATNPDVVIFRQVLPKPTELGDTIIPASPEIVWGNVGISYAVKLNWALQFPFKRSKHEDLLQLVALEAAGANIHFSNRLAYYARDKRL